MTPQTIYTVAKNSLGTHQTLNPEIPIDVGCAEAVSSILKKAGVKNIPELGIPGTASLYDWLSRNPAFKRVQAPEAGAIVVSATGTGNGSVHGHTGIFGKRGLMYLGDFGICSNDSQTGLFLELWSWKRWQQYYMVQGQLTTGIFVAK